MSSLGRRWAKVGPRCAAIGLSMSTARVLGGIDYLETLDSLTRAVLINSLTWKGGKPKRSGARKSPRYTQPRPKKSESPVSVERMMQLATRRAA